MMQDKPLVSIHIVSWNSSTHLPSCLQSVMDQSYKPISTMIVDNASVDGTIQWLASEYPQVHLLRNSRNLGFCRGHNQALRITDSPYVLCLNPDVVLSPTWIEQAIAIMEQRPELGALGGKLLRYTYSEEELKSVVPSGIIDSAGLQIFRSRHVIDRGSGDTDNGQYDQAEPVFGLTGACILFRRSALESIRWRDEYFDEDMFAYKDDIDVARRLARMGWVNWYDGSIVAYHHRSIRGQSSTGNLSIAKNYRRRELMNARYSYRNQWLIYVKHESFASIKSDWPWMLWYELRKAGWLLLTKPSVLAGGFSALRLRSVIKQKAILLNRSAKQPATIVRRWWTPSA